MVARCDHCCFRTWYMRNEIMETLWATPRRLPGPRVPLSVLSESCVHLERVRASERVWGPPRLSVKRRSMCVSHASV